MAELRLAVKDEDVVEVSEDAGADKETPNASMTARKASDRLGQRLEA